MRSIFLHAAGLTAANVAWQSLLWFSGLNVRPAALSVFFLFFPAALLLYAVGARRRGAGLGGLFAGGALVALLGGLGVAAMMWVFLEAIGGGVLPPVVEAQREALAAANDPADAAMLRKLNALTPTGFAVMAGVQNAILGVIEAAVIAAGVRLAMRGRG